MEKKSMNYLTVEEFAEIMKMHPGSVRLHLQSMCENKTK
jgi:hypothetical protein